MDVERWFQVSLAYRATPEDARAELSAPAHSSRLRVATLPEDIGVALDTRGAPFRVYRFVAWGVDEQAVRRRYDLVKRLAWERGRWPTDTQISVARRKLEGPRGDRR